MVGPISAALTSGQAYSNLNVSQDKGDARPSSTQKNYSAIQKPVRAYLDGRLAEFNAEVKRRESSGLTLKSVTRSGPIHTANRISLVQPSHHHLHHAITKHQHTDQSQGPQPTPSAPPKTYQSNHFPNTHRLANLYQKVDEDKPECLNEPAQEPSHAFWKASFPGRTMALMI
ncbi:hypothetical protein MJO28_011793 [Puccinia striiformis f. sp. tritici]|uniref:Uncharacterized protein n=1 Tax=Puccinia striiformis f. sp. tritici TaxID=168172 RepID=A0ACC0E350_9BASI|nr:hypothetical protein MJO28_011793 [Puccinia striiformis f. sp. tritici]